jgi:hypothetical protein
LIVLAAFAALHQQAAWGGVHVEGDEVIFSVETPEAKSVFLVGDFNNWNPTLEKMDRVGDRFELYLFLLPGTYRYKYVVDGKWISDPDNPPIDPKLGSILVLESRAGGLALASDERLEEDSGWLLKPSLRYVGLFHVDDGETGSDHIIDTYFRYEGKKMKSSVNLKTTDTSWEISPLRSEILFDRGALEVAIGGSKAVAFENDTIWTSRDPYRVLGDVGVYRYNAGHERRGVALEMPLVLKTTLRALYSDKIEEESAEELLVPGGDLADFAVSGGADTTVYRYSNSFADEDVMTLELFADAGSLKLGYVKRKNRGFHPGILADISRQGVQFRLSSFATREYWNADVAWFGYRIRPGLDATLAYGSANAAVRRSARAVTTVTTLGDVTLGQKTDPVEEEDRIQKSTRWHGTLRYEKRTHSLELGFESNRFEFRPPLYAPAAAEIRTATVRAAADVGRWSGVAGVRYTDQDYGDATPDFHFATPFRNYWLDYRDRLTIENMVAFDLDKSSNLYFSLFWNRRAPYSRRAAEEPEPLSGRVSGGAVTRGLLESIEYAFVEAGVEYFVRPRVYVQADARLASYRKPAWSLSAEYVSPYVEAGYRSGWMEVSAGYGLDPDVLDPVVNEYRRNGRLEHLREGLPTRITRDESSALGGQLRNREKALEDINSFKLECILFF